MVSDLMPELCGAQGESKRESESKIQFPFIRSFLSKSLSLPTFLLTVVVSRTEVSGAVDKWSYFNTGH